MRLRVVDHLRAADACCEFVCPIHERILAVARAAPLPSRQRTKARTKRAKRRLVADRHKEGVVPRDGPDDLLQVETIQRCGDGVRAPRECLQDQDRARRVNLRGASERSEARRTSAVCSTPESAGSAYASAPARSTLVSPSSVMSRLSVACVAGIPCDRNAATSSRWVRIGRRDTRSRNARWRSSFPRSTSGPRPRLRRAPAPCREGSAQTRLGRVRSSRASRRSGCE